jgi:hypothetical protein
MVRRHLVSWFVARHAEGELATVSTNVRDSTGLTEVKLRAGIQRAPFASVPRKRGQRGAGSLAASRTSGTRDRHVR